MSDAYVQLWYLRTTSSRVQDGRRVTVHLAFDRAFVERHYVL